MWKIASPLFLCLVASILLKASTAYQGPKEDVELSTLVSKMWNADVNRAEPGKDWTVNTQGSLRNKGKGSDEARALFFTKLNKNLFNKPTYKSFINLLDNYDYRVGRNEVETSQERSEIDDFLTKVMSTKVFEIAHAYLTKKGLAPASSAAFKNKLKKLWFNMYGRGNSADTSGFEHVFVGESKSGAVTGLHNWIQFYLQEKKGAIDYRGYYKAKCYKESRLFTVGFTWHDRAMKDFSSMLVGVSPEFEFTLYTTVFLTAEKLNGRSSKWNPIAIKAGPCFLQIQCYKIRGQYIGTCYVK